MTENEKIITSNPLNQTVRTEIVPLMTVPERTVETKEKTPITFKDATKDEIDSFVQNQKNLDEEGKARLSDRLLKIQQKLKQPASPDLGHGL